MKEYSGISLTELRGKSRFIETRDWPDIGQLKIVVILDLYYRTGLAFTLPEKTINIYAD